MSEYDSHTRQDLIDVISALEMQVQTLKAQLAAYNTSGFADADAMASAYLDMRVRAENAEAQVQTLREALHDCERYFDSRADADHNSERYVGNAEMDFLGIVRAALAATEPKP